MALAKQGYKEGGGHLYIYNKVGDDVSFNDGIFAAQTAVLAGISNWARVWHNTAAAGVAAADDEGT